MSDEPKKRSRGPWILWALITLFVLYPLSIGPVSWFDLFSTQAFERVYAPIDRARRQSEIVDTAFTWYLHLRDRPTVPFRP